MNPDGSVIPEWRGQVGPFSPSTTITYDVDSDSIRVAVDGPVINFDELFLKSNIDPSRSNATFTVYSKLGGSLTLTILNPGSPTLNLSYVTYGNWVFKDDAFQENFATGYMVFGIRTAAGSMPRSGTATFNGQTVGTMVDAGGTLYTVSGTGSLAADFAAATISGNFTGMEARNVQNSAVKPWRDFKTTGTISGNAFNGSAASKDGALSGLHYGGFFGPAAAEAGSNWFLSGGNEVAYGAFVGKK